MLRREACVSRAACESMSKRPYHDNARPHGRNGHHDAKRYRNADNVRNHYNARREVGRSQREESPIIVLRDVNNWVKSVLIKKHAQQDDCCFDMCCGKGGDMMKWAAVNASYVFGADIADKSIQDARDRLKNMRSRPFKCRLRAKDLSRVRLVDEPDCIPTTVETAEIMTFDCASCQFSLHYFFESEPQARTFFQNVTDRLKPGGFFFGTVPDAIHIVSELYKHHPRGLRRHEGVSMAFGNGLYKVDFDQYPAPDADFGAAYKFTLKTAVEDCTEYLVHPTVLRQLAAEYGLELVLYENFHEFFLRETEDPKSHGSFLLNKMVFRNRDAVPFDQWEIAGLYCVYAFRKRDDADVYAPARPAPREKTLEDAFF